MRLLFVSIIVSCFGTSIHADKIDDYLQRQLKEQNVPGLSLAVVRDARNHREVTASDWARPYGKPARINW
jgi:hypothetical protein